jgi:REP element-mobilizing transposase RayT
MVLGFMVTRVDRSIVLTMFTGGLDCRPTGSERERVQYEQRLLAMRPVKLNARRRTAVEKGIRDTCRKRNWRLWAFNIRTNHVHTVVSANCRTWQVLNALKANATRTLREAGCWRSNRSPWVRRGSKRRIWTDKQLADAIAYVLYEQGVPLP